MTERIFNETDERIVIEPGQWIDVKVDNETVKTTVQRVKKHRIKEVAREGE